MDSQTSKPLSSLLTIFDDKGGVLWKGTVSTPLFGIRPEDHIWLKKGADRVWYRVIEARHGIDAGEGNVLSEFLVATSNEPKGRERLEAKDTEPQPQEKAPPKLIKDYGNVEFHLMDRVEGTWTNADESIELRLLYRYEKEATDYLVINAFSNLNVPGVLPAHTSWSEKLSGFYAGKVLDLNIRGLPRKISCFVNAANVDTLVGQNKKVLKVSVRMIEYEA